VNNISTGETGDENRAIDVGSGHQRAVWGKCSNSDRLHARLLAGAMKLNRKPANHLGRELVCEGAQVLPVIPLNNFQSCHFIV